MICLTLKLKCLKQKLRWWNKLKFGNLFYNISIVGKEVSFLENNFVVGSGNVGWNQVCLAKLNLTNLQIMEREYWNKSYF